MPVQASFITQKFVCIYMHCIHGKLSGNDCLVISI